MPFYTYHCPDCSHAWDARRTISGRDNCPPCPECGCVETTRDSVYDTRFNLEGDDWPSKAGRVNAQMAAKNAKLKAKEEQVKRDAPPVKLAPNVQGERVDTWSEAKKLAESRGLNGASYEPMIAKEEELKKAPTTT